MDLNGIILSFLIIFGTPLFFIICSAYQLGEENGRKERSEKNDKTL